MTKKTLLTILKLSEVLPTCSENYHFIRKVWKKEEMQTFKDFFPISEVLQELQEEVCQVLVGEHSKVLTRETVIDETLIRKSSNI